MRALLPLLIMEILILSTAQTRIVRLPFLMESEFRHFHYNIHNISSSPTPNLSHTKIRKSRTRNNYYANPIYRCAFPACDRYSYIVALGVGVSDLHFLWTVRCRRCCRFDAFESDVRVCLSERVCVTAICRQIILTFLSQQMLMDSPSAKAHVASGWSNVRRTNHLKQYDYEDDDDEVDCVRRRNERRVGIKIYVPWNSWWCLALLWPNDWQWHHHRRHQHHQHHERELCQCLLLHYLNRLEYRTRTTEIRGRKDWTTTSIAFDGNRNQFEEIGFC